MILKMKLLIFFLMLANQCHSIEDRNHPVSDHRQSIQVVDTYLNDRSGCISCILRKNSSNNNCFKHINDGEIHQGFPFYVALNPKQPSSSQTYALVNKNKNIYYLNIVNQLFFPSIGFCLQHLEELHVRKTSFVLFNHQLPSMIKILSKTLINLEISNTKINYLPNEIGNFMKLNKLILSNTGLMSLPDSIGDLSSLKFLLLPNNKLTYLPKTMKNLRSLEQLTLTNNPHLYSIEAINGLPLLGIIQTENCLIQHLPRNLPQLTSIYMSNNNLTNLTDIQTLGYGTDSKKSFYFDRNSIQSIPSEIGHVRHLSLLNINHNRLKHLPLSIFNINTLENLYIRNNSFSDADLEEIIKIFKRTNPKLIINYLNDMNSRKKP